LDIFYVFLLDMFYIIYTILVEPFVIFYKL
jgi:hypothetical protein